MILKSPFANVDVLKLFNFIIFSVGGAIRCIKQEGVLNNQTVEQCESNYQACSVVWSGATAKEAVITSRACWSNSDTRQLDNFKNCPFGPCIPQKLPLKDIAAYFCCCQGDLCNKIPEPINLETTHPPICELLILSLVVNFRIFPQSSFDHSSLYVENFYLKQSVHTIAICMGCLIK